MHISVYIAASLDGYIATLDGGVGWLSDFEGGDEDHGFAEFYARVDAMTDANVETAGGWMGLIEHTFSLTIG